MVVLFVLIGLLIVTDGFVVQLFHQIDLGPVAERVDIVWVHLKDLATPSPCLGKIM
jgi:hypothetical protein